MQRLYRVTGKLLVLSALFIALGAAFPAAAQTTVTPAPGPGYTFCTGGNNAAIGTILIQENTANSYPVTGALTRFRLRLPAGFVFNNAVTPVITAPGPDDFSPNPAFVGYFNSDTEIEISYQVTTSVAADVISIAGLQVRATGLGSGNIIRVASTGPEANQPGNNVGDNVSHGSLTTANFSVSLSSSDPDNQVCAGQLVTFTATPTIASGANTYEFFRNGVSVQGPGTFPQYTSALNDNDEITVSATYSVNGCTNTITAGNGITTDVLPLPSVTAAAGPFTICGNSFADLTGTIFSNSPGIVWASSGDGSFQPNALTANARYYPGPNDIINGSVTLTVTTTGSACTADSDNVNVTINPLPTPSITGLNAVCENQTNVIYTTPNVVGNTYSWSITGGTITAGAGTNSITVTWGAAGTGTLQLTETITASTCAVTTAVYNVTKNANPTPVIGGPATVCAAQASNVYSTTNVVGNSYSWTVSGGTITAGAGTNSITVTWGSGASGTVQLTETVTATGCATTTANYPVTINPLPTPSITGLNAVCENQTNVIYSTPNVVGNTYSWSITGGTITAGAGTNSITVTWGAAGTGTLQLTETITASTCAVTTAVYNVTKNANPTPVIGGPATVCANQTANVYSTTNVVGHSYSWTVSGGTITAGAGTNSITVTWGSGASGTVQLTETITATGCATTTANYNVTINPLPTPSITGLNAVCENQVGVVYSTPNVVGNTYSWSITGGTITAGATTNSITVTWGAAGTGTLQLTETITASTCAVTTSVYNVTKNANPTPVIGGPATVCANQTANVYSTTNVVGHSYSWTVSGGTITAGAGTNSITVTWGSGASGTVQLTETVTATGCATTTANYPVTINPLPTPSITGLNAVCENQTNVIYSTPNVVGNTYSWSITGGTITAGAGTNSITVTWGAAGTGTLQLTETITSSTCAVTTAVYNVTKNANPTPVIGGPATVCAAQAGNVYSTTNVVGNSYSWTVSGGTITAGAGTNSITVTWGSGASGTVQLTETVTATGCATTTANYPVTINPLPTPSITGLNAVCENQTNVIYSTPNVVGNTYSWSITGGTITAGAGTNSITVTWGAAGTGTLQLTETITSSTCAVTTAVYNVTKNANPTPVIGGPATVCAAQAGNVYSTTNVVGNSYSWTVSGGTITAGAGTNSITVTWGSGASGTVQLTETVTATGCATTTANYNVTINPLPTPSITGLNAVCENQVGVVYSTPNVVGNTYSWSITGGTITAGAGTNSITVTWGAAGTGTLQLTETITSSTCAVTTAVYNVTKNANPTPVIGGPATVCAAQAGNVYSTTNVVGNSYSWTVSGGTITAGAGTNSITVTWGSGASGTVQLTETVTATGCATTTANYPVTINPLPTPSITGLNAVCENQTNVIYSTPNVVGNTYSWSITGGTITAGAGTNSITVTWGAAGTGTLQLTETITSSTCAVTTAVYNVTKNANPTPVIGGPATVCAAQAGNVYSTTNVVGNSYSWTVSGGTITAGAGTNSITVTWGSGASGTVQLTETITATGCATTTANYNVTINPLPTPSITGLNAVCENQVGVVYSTPNVVGNTYSWSITGGTITAGAGTNSITVTWGAAGTGTLQLTETITSSTCAVTTAVYNVTKNANPTPVIGGPATVCAAQAGNVYSTTNVVGNSYSWTVSGGTITAGAGTNSITVTWGSGASGTVQLTETITATGCATTTANYNVTINPLPTPSITGLNAVCENQVGVVYTTPNVVGNTYSWSITGGTITAGATTNSITVTWGAAGTGTLQLTETITASTCAVTTAVYNVTKNANPTPVIGGPATVCAAQAGNVYSTTNVVGNSYSWTVSGGTITAGAGTNSITVTWGSGASGTVQLTETITATGCATTTANYNVTINPLPTPSITGLNAVCENQVGVVYSTPNVVGNTYSWSITGGTITAGAGTNSITVTWGAAGTGTLQLTETITSSTCAVTTAVYNVTKNANPTPVIGGPATVCAAQAGNVYSTTNVVGNSYSWTVSGGTITAGAGTNSITVTWGSGASGTVQLTETITATGCATTTANYNVTINPLPTPSITGLNAVCENQVGVVYTTPNVVGNTYSWSITGGTITAGATTNSITVTWGAAGTGTLQLTETITASTCAVTTAVYNVTKNANPTPVIGGPATVCANQTANVYSTTNVVGNSYSWTVSGGTITAGAGTNSITVTWGSGASGTVQLTETITATGCATTTANYNVTINPLPTPSITGLNAVCENQVGVVYTTPNVVGNTYSWSITGGTITAGATTNSITVTWGAAGTGTLQLTETITSSTCAVTTAVYNVTKNANPTPVIGGPATVCAAQAGNVYSTTNVVGNSYSWTVSGGTITAGAGTNSITVTWGSGASGTVQLTETVTATGCATTTANYNVTINPLPTPSITGLNAVCENQVGVVYSTPNVVGNTYSWSITGGTITAGAGTNSITVTWGAAGTGTLQLTETITSSTCAVTTAVYNVTKNANPTPVIGGPATVCAAQAGNVYSTTNVVGNSYSWTVSGGTITAGAGTNSITVTWGSGASGTVQLTETVTATGCATTTANYNVTINPLPTPSITGLNAVCENQTNVIYTTPNVVGNTYSWSITGGTITAGAGTNSITVTWGAAGTGTLQLTETITSSTCAVTTAVYNVTKNANPTPVIGGPATVCAAQAGNVYSTTNVVGNSYSWTVSGGTITAGAGTNSITVTWGSGASGTVQLTETVTATGCATTTANYPVTINPLPTPSITGLNAVCENQTNVIYSTPNVVGNTYSWSITGGTITAGAGTNSITVTWGAAGTGTLQLTETITSSTCAVTTAVYNVTKNANPTPVIGGPATVCAAQAGNVYSTTNVVGNSYSWTVSGGTITAGAGTNSITVTWGSGASGTVQLTETVTATGCATTTANYPVTINPLPTPSITGLNAVCENQTNVIYSTPNVVGNTYSWSITGGTITAGATTNSITVTWGAAGTGTLQLTETITSSTCAVTTAVYNVTKNANPTPVIGGPATVCAAQASNVYSTTNVVGNSYSWTVSGGTITAGAGTNSITVTWGSGASGTVQLTETVTATGCATTTANYPVTINPLPTPSITGLNAVCENQVGVVYTTPNVVGNTYSWSITGGTITAGAGTNSITVTWGAAGTGTLQLTETITSSTCAVTTAVYNVTKNANPTPVIGGPATVCAAQASNVYSTTNVVGNSYSWTVSGGTITAGAGTNSITVTWGSGASGTVQLTETITATGCATTTANYPVTINPLPTPSITGLNAVCENQTNVIYSTPNVVGNTYSWSITGGTITAGATTNSITVTWGAAGTGTLQLTETITSSTCAVTTAVYNVTKNANPTPVIGGPATVCAAQASNVYSTTNVVGNSYSWTVSGGTITAGAGTNSITVTWGSGASGTVQLTETITATGCATTTPAYVVTINPNPVVTAISNQVACNGGTIAAITLSASTGGGETYNWIDGTPVGMPNGSDNTAPFEIPAFTAVNGGTSPVTVPVKVSATKNGCTGPLTIFNVTVNPSPTFTITNLTPTACEGTAANITLTSPTANAIITLISATYSGATGGSYTGGETFTSGQKINETLGNPTESPITVTYRFSVSANGCTDPVQQTTTITINPAPPVFSIANTTASICTGALTNIILNTPTLNALVRLDAVSYGTATGSTLVIGSTYTTGQVIAQTLTNATNAPTTVTYTFSVSANGCNNLVQQQTTVVVNPSPTMSINNVTGSICSGSAVNITLNSPTSAAVMRLTSVNYNGAIGTLTAPQNYTNGSIITESLTNPTNNPITVTYDFDVSANGCSTAGPFTTTVTVKPTPVFTITNASSQVCEGTQTDITLHTPTFGGQVRLDAVNYNGATGTLTVGQLFTDGQKITEVLVNPTNLPITVTYTFSVSANSCSNPVQQQTTVTITRSPTVSVPADYTVCEPATIPLTGTIGASAVSGLWSIISGTGTLSATNVSGTTVTANYSVGAADIGNIITLRLTTNDPDGPGPCSPVFDDINIRINRAASITAGIDLAQCRDQASIALQGAITYAPNGVSWSGGTGTFGTAGSPTSTYSFNNPSEVNTNVTLTLTANDPDGAGPTGPCGIVTDQMILRINQLPTVVFSGFGPGAPPQIAENASPILLTGNQSGGTFTISPITSSIGSTTHLPVDEVSFDPSAVDLGSNFVTYTYTDANGCTNFQQQQVIVNPVTDIDFTLQYASGALAGTFIPSNGTGGFDFCGEVGDVRIVGNPVASSGINPTNFTAVGANAAILNAKISQVGPDYFINTNGLPSDNYLLQYTYTNSLGVTSAPLIRPLKVFASPIATINNLTNNCIASSILFTDGSTLPPTPFPNNPATWSYRWDFGDGQFGTLKNQPHPYSASGVYNVTLTVTTGPVQSCSGSTSMVVRVGDVPVVDFAWSAICTNDNTKFQDETDPGPVSTIDAYTWDFGDGNTLSGPPGGIIPPGTHGGSTFGTYDNPEHNYSIPGSKNVVLGVTTNDGCNNSKLKTISILVSGATVTPDALTPYTNNFEIPDSEWIPEGFEISTNPDVFSNVSWQFGVPAGAVINPTVDPNTTSAWWTGANTNSYYTSEESAVNGPCFDLRSLTRPMVTLDYWSDAEQNLDGAALQYSTDGGLNWNIVGPLASSPNEGINWYNGQTVQSNPGRQPFGSNGWTGKMTAWKNGRFNLDMIPQAERDQVRLRVAFSSNNTNDPSKTFDGFAFDNVFIGERKRNVMVEYFTNAGINASTNTYFDNLYAAQFTGPTPKDSSDFFKIQYHISNPSPDPINQQNPVDPAARSLFYGISQPPSAIMDGILGNYFGTTFNGNYLTITEEQLERRSLEDPLFDVTLDTLAATATTIKFHAEFTYKHPTLAFSTPVTVHVALVEDNLGIPSQRNVLRKFLLGTEGVTLDLPWSYNHMEAIDRDLEIDAPIGTNNNNLYLVAFIQDKRFDSKLIHQSIKIKLNKKTQAVITGTDDPVFDQVKNIAIYPNPATRFANFATEVPLTKEYQYSIVDQRGITVLSGNLNRDLTIPQQVELSNIADGVYVVMITHNGRRLIQRKLAVLKR